MPPNLRLIELEKEALVSVDKLVQDKCEDLIDYRKSADAMIKLGHELKVCRKSENALRLDDNFGNSDKYHYRIRKENKGQLRLYCFKGETLIGEYRLTYNESLLPENFSRRRRELFFQFNLFGLEFIIYRVRFYFIGTTHETFAPLRWDARSVLERKTENPILS